MQGLGFNRQAEANLHMLTMFAIESSEIEGFFLNQDQLRSSVARKLGIELDDCIRQ